LSDRAIAELCGVHHSTVGAHRRQVESTGGISQLTSRVGLDGRTRSVSDTKEIQVQEEPSGEAKGDAGEKVERLAEPASPVDRCRCGGEWESDGNGGRFCLTCKVSHPDNQEPYPDNSKAGQRPRVTEPTTPAIDDESDWLAVKITPPAPSGLARTVERRKQAQADGMP
jgi:hypothetical protein